MHDDACMLFVLYSCLMFIRVWQGLTHKSEQQGLGVAFSVNFPLVFLKQFWILKRLFLQNQYQKKQNWMQHKARRLFPVKANMELQKWVPGLFFKLATFGFCQLPLMPSVAITSAAWRAIFKGSPSRDMFHKACHNTISSYPISSICQFWRNGTRILSMLALTSTKGICSVCLWVTNLHPGRGNIRLSSECVATHDLLRMCRAMQSGIDCWWSFGRSPDWYQPHLGWTCSTCTVCSMDCIKAALYSNTGILAVEENSYVWNTT